MILLGIVKLAPGQVGFYDELTRIHLVISKPEAAVYEHMNRTNLKRSVKSGRLLLVSGSLDPETNLQHAVVEVPVKTAPKVEIKEVAKTEAPVVSEAVELPVEEPAKVEETPVVETIVEAEVPAVEPEVVEAVIEEAKVEETKVIIEEAKVAPVTPVKVEEKKVASKGKGKSKK
jgi:uncharacterized protein YgbK (DUF1537 family)